MENLSIQEYLTKIGFEKEDIETILEYANSDIDRKILHEKVKFLISLGLEAREIRIIIEEDLLFITEDFSLIEENGKILKNILSEDEIKIALETTPELLTVRKGELEQNIKMLKLLIPNKEAFNIVIQDRGEILTYKPDYLSDKFSFLVNNGLKDNILKILIEDIEIFDLDNSEIDVEELKIK